MTGEQKRHVVLGVVLIVIFFSPQLTGFVSQARINEEFNSFKVQVQVEGYGQQVIHFAHQRSTRLDAIPLLFVAGWPGSFLEARKIIKPLTEPADAKTVAFHFVVASIPGYGPGDPTTKSGFGPVHTARAFKQVMVDVLGYERFVTQGGDWGTIITRSMVMQYPQHVRAYHVNFLPCFPPPWYKAPLAIGRLILNSFLYSASEKARLARVQYFLEEQQGYVKLQSTRPQTLGFALGDSPIGVLGWFMEKFHEWMDFDNYNMPPDEILTFVMMHWMQGVTPGLRFYKAAFNEKDETSLTKALRVYSSTPLGVSVFPKETVSPPRDWTSIVANVQYWKEHPTGGHFPAVECPDKLVNDLREWFSSDVVKSAMAS